MYLIIPFGSSFLYINKNVYSVYRQISSLAASAGKMDYCRNKSPLVGGGGGGGEGMGCHTSFCSCSIYFSPPFPSPPLDSFVVYSLRWLTNNRPPQLLLSANIPKVLPTPSPAVAEESPPDVAVVAPQAKVNFFLCCLLAQQFYTCRHFPRVLILLQFFCC